MAVLLLLPQAAAAQQTPQTTDNAGNSARPAEAIREKAPETPAPEAEGQEVRRRNAEPDRLKPFVPTEEIRVDNAVDFPTDI